MVPQANQSTKAWDVPFVEMTNNNLKRKQERNKEKIRKACSYNVAEDVKFLALVHFCNTSSMSLSTSQARPSN